MRLFKSKLDFSEKHYQRFRKAVLSKMWDGTFRLDYFRDDYCDRFINEYIQRINTELKGEWYIQLKGGNEKFYFLTIDPIKLSRESFYTQYYNEHIKSCVTDVLKKMIIDLYMEKDKMENPYIYHSFLSDKDYDFLKQHLSDLGYRVEKENDQIKIYW